MKTIKISNLKATAREQLLGKYKTVILAYLIMELLLSGCLSLVEGQLNLKATTAYLLYYAVYLIVVLFTGVFMAGQSRMYLHISRNQEYSVKDLGYCFQNLADKSLLLQLFILLKALVYALPLICSTFLFITYRNQALLPFMAAALVLFGIGALLTDIRYSQVFFLINDNEELSVKQCMTESNQMMKGYKLKYLFFVLSFIGMGILSLLSFGLANLWIYPYFMAARTEFYLNLTN